jgi:hypothetical protein
MQGLEPNAALAAIGSWLRQQQGVKRARRGDDGPHEDQWVAFLSYVCSHRAAVDEGVVRMGCELVLELGESEWSSPEAYWGDAGVKVAWDVLALACVAEPARLVPAALGILAERAGRAVTSRRAEAVAGRLLDCWPDAAFPAALRLSASPAHPFAAALAAGAAGKWREPWRVRMTELVARGEWGLALAVLRSLPDLAAAALDSVCLLASPVWPTLPAEHLPVVAACISRRARGSAPLLRALCCLPQFSGRPDVAALRDLLHEVHLLPALPHDCFAAWQRCVDEPARRWLLRQLRAAPLGHSYRMLLLQMAAAHFGPREEPLVTLLWEALPPAAAAEALEGALRQSLHEEAAVRCAAFAAGQERCRDVNPWPVTLLAEAAARRPDAALPAFEALLSRPDRPPPPAAASALGSLCALPAVLMAEGGEAALTRLLIRLAALDRTHVARAFSCALIDALLEPKSPFRSGVAFRLAPRADRMTFAEHPPQSTVETDADLGQALLSSGVATWKSKVVPSSQPALLDQSAELCAALGRVLSGCFATSPQTGLLAALGRQLTVSTVPRHLHHPLFDMDAHAATLPRVHRDRATEDVFVDALFAQNPALYEVLGALAAVPVAAAYCHRPAAALLCHLIGSCFAQRARRAPVVLGPGARRLLAFLCATQSLAPAMLRVESVLRFALPVEAAHVLLACWRFLTRFPPQPAEYDASTGSVRTLSAAALAAVPALLLPFRLCVAAHVQEAARGCT